MENDSGLMSTHTHTTPWKLTIEFFKMHCMSKNVYRHNNLLLSLWVWLYDAYTIHIERVHVCVCVLMAKICVIIFQYLRFTFSGHLNVCAHAHAPKHWALILLAIRMLIIVLIVYLAYFLQLDFSFGVCSNVFRLLLLASRVDLSWFQMQLLSSSLWRFIGHSIDENHRQMHRLWWWWWRWSVVELRSSITPHNLRGKYVNHAHICLFFSLYFEILSPYQTNWIGLNFAWALDAFDAFKRIMAGPT